MSELARVLKNNMISDRHKINGNIFVIFVYATLIVDLIRKINQIYIQLTPISVEIFRDALYIMIFLYVIYNSLISRNIKIVLISVFAFFIVIFMSYFITPAIGPMLPDTILFFISRCIPGFYFGYYIRDFKSLMHKLQLYSLIAVIYALLIIFYAEETSGNYMPISYNLLIPVLVSLYGLIYEKKYYFLISSLVFLRVIIEFGARGPLVCIFSACLIMIYFKIKEINLKKRIIIAAAAVLVIAIFAIFYNFIVSKLILLFPTSRTVQLIYNNLFDTTGRNPIYESSFKIILRDPFKIRGVLSDRILLNSFFDSNTVSGTYAHNFILELFLQFGVIFALIILIYLTYKTLKSFSIISKTDNTYLKMFFSIIFGYSIVHLMFSGSYITSFDFWLYLGLILSVDRNYKKYKSQQFAQKMTI